MTNKACHEEAIPKDAEGLAYSWGDNPCLFIDGTEFKGGGFRLQGGIANDPIVFIEIDDLKRMVTPNKVIFLAHNDRSIGGGQSGCDCHLFKNRCMQRNGRLEILPWGS